jgi:hypothetical protein
MGGGQWWWWWHVVLNPTKADRLGGVAALWLAVAVVVVGGGWKWWVEKATKAKGKRAPLASLAAGVGMGMGVGGCWLLAAPAWLA